VKRLAVSILATLACLLIVAVFAHQFLVSGLRTEISNEHAGLSALLTEHQQLDTELKMLSEKVKEQRNTGSAGRLMRPGEESLLLGTILSIASSSEVIVQRYELKQAFRVKGETETQGTSMRSESAQPAQLPQLDENGMPVGAITDEGDDEWPGVEVIPASLQIKATFSSIGRFFDQLKRLLPLSGIQLMQLDLDGSGIVRGNVRITFPVAAPQNSTGARNTIRR